MTTTIIAPASKSMSHRALLAAGLAQGVSHLTGVLESDDTARTIDFVNATGGSVTRTGPGAYTVTGNSGTCSGGAGDAPVDVFVGESGTTCRLVIPLMAAGIGDFHLHGAPRMHERPVGELVAALGTKGVSIAYKEKEGCLPLFIQAAGLLGGELDISMEESSQYLSGLLLACPIARRPLTVNVVGKKAVSWPYVALTLQTMDDFGPEFCVDTRAEGGEWQEADWRAMTEVVPGQTRFRVKFGMYRAQEHYGVEGDWSNASYFLIAGAVGPDPVKVTGLSRDSLQGDRAICDILSAMGARISWDADGVTAAPPKSGRLRGIEVDMGACPDLVPGVAVAAALAEGTTTISNVAHLKIKECDRLAAPAMELAKAGAVVETTDDGMRITPIANPGEELAGKELFFSSHNDHRIAMSLSILSRAGAHVAFDDPGVVAKSFPGFFDAWKEVG